MARLKEIPEEEAPPPAPAHEFTGLVLLASGLVLFLSLISYTPADIPSWLPFHSTAAASGSRHTLNFLGTIGAILGLLAYSLLGSAAYLLCATLLGYGSAKLIVPGTRLTRRALWSLLFVASGACLAQLLNYPLLDAQRLELPGEGGLLGKLVGEALLRDLVGMVGACLLLATVYLLSLLYMTGIRPGEVLQFLLKIPPMAAEAFTNWREARAEARALRQAEMEMALTESARISAATSSAKNERKKSASSRSEPASPAPSPTRNTPSEASEEPPPRPAPKIIDGTAPPPAANREALKPKKDLSLLPSVDCEGYKLPSIDLLEPIDLAGRQTVDPAELQHLQNVVIDTLQQFGIEVSAGDITRGPTITRYEVLPAKGVRVDRILALERDIARATKAERINILAPIPGKDTVGIEIANSKKQKVTLRELFESEDFSDSKAKIPIALGKDVYGKTIVADLAAMPHGLVAGTTGSGKSVCINAIIASILYRFTPEELRFIMIDPKVVEMQMYNSLPHLVVPVVTDPKKVLLALRWAVDEMEKRYAIFAKTGVRNIATFNSRPKPKSQRELDAEKGQGELFDPATGAPAAEAPLRQGPPSDPDAAILEALKDPDAPLPEDAEALASIQSLSAAHSADTTNSPEEADTETAPEELSSEERIHRMTTVRVPRERDLIIPDRMSYIVIIVDELADLMQTAPADVESAIARITQKARAAGIHMIIATQTPRADVITGVIKANVPCRVAFQVASALDSRVILDENGAEKLLGMGDMLYRPPGTSRMIRAQGVLVIDDEVRRLVEFASSQKEPEFENSIQKRLDRSEDEEGAELDEEEEELLEKCIEIMRQEKKASTSLFQRRLRLGYTRAARVLDLLESRGYVGPGEGAKPREILVDLDTL
jgi:S-DNA-T family DNA segregation ATPase FtsK/SpoIIIE